MDDIYPILNSLNDIKSTSVLATITHVEGSAYKKEGSCMIFHEDTTQTGMLSANCLEEDLSYHAIEVRSEGSPKTVSYNMLDERDGLWGQGVGCNGVIYVLLEPFDDSLRNMFKDLKESLDMRKHMCILREFNQNFEFVNRELFSADYQTEEQDSTKRGAILEYENDSYFYKQFVLPQPRLIIFGAGPDTRPLVNLASELHFKIIVCDWRSEYNTQTNLPGVHEHMIGFPMDILPKISITKYDFIVVMTHNFTRDQEILTYLVKNNSESKYIGVLGPKRRTYKLLDVSKLPNNLYSPIGLSIGAKGAKEISISIIAEIIDVYHYHFDFRLKRTGVLDKQKSSRSLYGSR
ncbi:MULTISPECIES: XdhC family protein [Bacillaceae]|uniref:XdhC family protein n=1 Tax=Evansella alkalicola TaxID=745819 RepID=A0ABS6JXX4_9BACI|nr:MULTISPECIES: XdhC/CoxI family protein [Bacillaceae]MBU9722067.1 XdhC family protein [Bacillus alkalicola]